MLQASRASLGLTWKTVRVRSLRSKHGIAGFVRGEEPQYVALSGAAKRLGIAELTVRRLIQRGVLPGRQVVAGAPWVIATKDLDLPRVKSRPGSLADS